MESQESCQNAMGSPVYSQPYISTMAYPQFLCMTPASYHAIKVYDCLSWKAASSRSAHEEKLTKQIPLSEEGLPEHGTQSSEFCWCTLTCWTRKCSDIRTNDSLGWHQIVLVTFTRAWLELKWGWWWGRNSDPDPTPLLDQTNM